MSVSIVLEGPEGAGKTTQAQLVSRCIQDCTDFPVLLVREPGGTSAGEAIRHILLNGDEFRDMHANTHMLLFSAARNELLEKKIYPFLDKHSDGIVIGDRCWLSTLVLQSTDGAREQYIRSVQEPFMNQYPNKIIYFDLPAEESMIRVQAAKHMRHDQNWRDGASISVYQDNRERYLTYAREFSEKVIVVDSFESMIPLTTIIVRNVLESLKKTNPELEGRVNMQLENINQESMRQWGEKVLYSDFIDQEMFARFIKYSEQFRVENNFESSEVLRSRMHMEWEQRGLGVEGGAIPSVHERF